MGGARVVDLREVVVSRLLRGGLLSDVRGEDAARGGNPGGADVFRGRLEHDREEPDRGFLHIFGHFLPDFLFVVDLP